MRQKITWLVIAICCSKLAVGANAPTESAVGIMILRGINNENLGECKVFATGYRNITTAAHCVKNGAVGATVYFNFDKNGKAGVVAKTTGTILTGGGFDPDDQLKGRDWAHIYLDRVITSDTLKSLDLSEEDAKEGTDVKLLSVRYDNQKRPYYHEKACKIVRAPEAALKSCESIVDRTDPKNPKEQLLCNFFSHTCQADKGDSGAPIISTKTGKVIGIYTGKGRAEDTADKVWPWAGTTNESPFAYANVYYKWYVMKNYHWINTLSARSKDHPIKVNIKDDKDTYARDILNLAKQWGTLSAKDRFVQLFKWESLLGQMYILDYGKQVDAQYVAILEKNKNRPLLKDETIDIDWENRFKVERPKKETGEIFGVYYNGGGAPQLQVVYRYHTLDNPKTAKDKDNYLLFAKSELARVAALEKQGLLFRSNERDAMATNVGKILNVRDENAFATLARVQFNQPQQQPQQPVFVQAPVPTAPVLVPIGGSAGGFYSTTTTITIGSPGFGGFTRRGLLR